MPSTTDNKQTPVLIVGAGIAGLTLALALKKNGVDVRILDKNDRVTIARRAVGVQGRTLEMHKVLGILPEVLERSGPITPLTWAYPPNDPYNHAKTIPFVDHLENTPSKSYINTLAFSQDRHEAIFREVLTRFGVSIEMHKELVDFKQHDDYVIVHVKGPDGKVEEIKTSWLVGADGAHSTIRKLSGLTFLGEQTPRDLMVLSDIKVKSDLNQRVGHLWGDPSDAAFWFHSHEDLTLGTWTVIALGPNQDLDAIASSLEVFQREFNKVSKRTDIIFEKMYSSVNYRPHVRMVNKFREGRVLVVGDAAHVHSATGGQGLNTGVQDSVNLGWKLPLIVKKLAGDALLESFSAERTPVVASMLALTYILYNRTVNSEAGDHRGLSRAEFELRQFGVNYRESPVIVDETPKVEGEVYDAYRSGDDEKARAGDRAPDGLGLIGQGKPAKTAYDLFDITYHAVLVFAPTITDASPVVKRVALIKDALFKAFVILPQTSSIPILEENVLKDTTGWVYKNYRVEEGKSAVVVVRPDSFIGARVSGVEGFNEYLKAAAFLV